VPSPRKQSYPLPQREGCLWLIREEPYLPISTLRSKPTKKQKKKNFLASISSRPILPPNETHSYLSRPRRRFPLKKKKVAEKIKYDWEDLRQDPLNPLVELIGERSLSGSFDESEYQHAPKKL